MMKSKVNAQEPAGPPCDCPKFKKSPGRGDYLVLHSYACLQIRRAGRSMGEYYSGQRG